MKRCNIVPSQLRNLNYRDYNKAIFAQCSEGTIGTEASQLIADKIIRRHADNLWKYFKVRWVASYDRNQPANQRATREGDVVSAYTRRISRGAYRTGYAAIRDVTDATAWRRYRIAGTK